MNVLPGLGMIDIERLRVADRVTFTVGIEGQRSLGVDVWIKVFLILKALLSCKCGYTMLGSVKFSQVAKVLDIARGRDVRPSMSDAGFP